MSGSSRRLARLDALRGFAALYVFAVHSHLPASYGYGWWGRFGQEAVMLFFILSGFVIYYTTFQQSDPYDFPRYLSRRVRRIYPIFLVALLLAYVNLRVACWGTLRVDWYRLGLNLLMLQDFTSAKPGCLVGGFCGNVPLWSLSYEWWSYMLFFPVVYFLRERPGMQKYVVAAISFAGCIAYQFHHTGPLLFPAYFLIWWTGVEMAREYMQSGHITWRGQRQQLCLLAGLAALWSIQVVQAYGREPLKWAEHPILQFQHATATLVLAAGGIAWHKARFAGFWPIFRWFVPLAGISYSLYVLHLPVMWYGKYFEFIPNPLLRLAAYFVALVPVCIALELVLQPALNRLLTWRPARASRLRLQLRPA